MVASVFLCLVIGEAVQLRYIWETACVDADASEDKDSAAIDLFVDDEHHGYVSHC